MPTVQRMEIPLPKDWQEFESIVRDAQAQRWKGTNLVKNGRSGQKQDGVDIYGPDEIGRPVGIQCKRYKGSLTQKLVEKEISEAEQFKGKLTTLFIATTADRDAKLQEQVRSISDSRVAQGRFAVSILYWDEIVAGLVLNPAVFNAHYPQIVLNPATEVDKERQLAALDLGYYGADLWEFVILIFGEAGWLSQQDPDEFYSILRILERRSQQLLSPEDAAPITVALEKVIAGCEAEKNSEEDWESTKLAAKRVSNRIQAASSHLGLAESNMLEIARSLGVIYHHVDDLPTLRQRKELKSKVKAVLPAESEKAIDSDFLRANRLKSGYRWASCIYTLIDTETRFRG